MDYKEALAKAADICARQEKCISDIEKKLYQWQVEPQDKEKVIEYLLDQKFIDEQRFVKAYVKEKFIFNRWGKIKIQWQLKTKGIQGSIVKNELEQINSYEYKSTLIQLLTQKRKSIKGDDVYKIKNSLIRYASSRGFEPDLIYLVIDDILDV